MPTAIAVEWFAANRSAFDKLTAGKKELRVVRPHLPASHGSSKRSELKFGRGAASSAPEGAIIHPILHGPMLL
jgi:hypothetical protein